MKKTQTFFGNRSILGANFEGTEMNFNDNVPTVFAASLALACEIMIEAKPGVNHHEYAEKLARLRAFQQMAIVVPFEECIIAFHGQELSDDQTEVLKIIYKSTEPWMLGHVVGVLLDRLESKITNKDFAESVKTIIEQLTKDGEDGPSDKLKGMLVTFANTGN